MEVLDWLNSNSNLVSSLILGLFGISITLIYYNRTTRLSRDRMEYELFTAFNERYDELNDSLEHIAWTYSSEQDMRGGLEYEKRKKDIIDYFNLCAEEYYWKEKGRINDIIWNSWYAGMNYWYNHPDTSVIRDLWAQETKNGTSSYYIPEGKEGFFIVQTSLND